MKLQDSKNLFVLGGFLGAVALIAALVLAWVSQLTAGPIKSAGERNRLQAFHRLLLPEFNEIGDSVKARGFIYYPVFNQDRNVGWVGQGSTRKGYGGLIEILVGFNVDGKISAVQVLRHNETPGLGANVCERKFQRTIFNLNEDEPAVPDNRILDQFNSVDSKQAGGWKISKDGGKFDFLTGATVTSRAITDLVDQMAEIFASEVNK